jgi:hypothetical protein
MLTDPAALKLHDFEQQIILVSSAMDLIEEGQRPIGLLFRAIVRSPYRVTLLHQVEALMDRRTFLSALMGLEEEQWAPLRNRRNTIARLQLSALTFRLLRTHHHRDLCDKQHPLFECFTDAAARFYKKQIEVSTEARWFKRAWDWTRQAYRGMLLTGQTKPPHLSPWQFNTDPQFRCYRMSSHVVAEMLSMLHESMLRHCGPDLEVGPDYYYAPHITLLGGTDSFGYRQHARDAAVKDLRPGAELAYSLCPEGGPPSYESAAAFKLAEHFRDNPQQR